MKQTMASTKRKFLLSQFLHAGIPKTFIDKLESLGILTSEVVLGAKHYDIGSEYNGLTIDDIK